MKKLFLLAIMLVGFINIQAQIIGVDFSKAIDTETVKDRSVKYEMLYTFDDIYYYPFEYNNIGIMHSYLKLREILSANGIAFDYPEKDLTYLPKWVESYTDYSAIKLACSTKEGEIAKKWALENGWRIMWIVNDEIAAVNFFKN